MYFNLIERFGRGKKKPQEIKGTQRKWQQPREYMMWVAVAAKKNNNQTQTLPTKTEKKKINTQQWNCNAI